MGAPDATGVTLDRYNATINDIWALQSKYNNGVASRLLAYYSNQEGASGEYWKYITSMSLLRRLRQCHNAVLKTAKAQKNKKIIEGLDLHRAHTLVVPPQKCNMDKCKMCSGEMMSVESGLYEICKLCSWVRNTAVMVVDDTSDGPCVPKGSKNSNQHMYTHFNDHISFIQGWTGPIISPAALKQLRRCLRRDRIRPSIVHCKVLREYLKECRLTTYNNYIPLIRILLGGPQPPQLTFEEIDRARSIFLKIARKLVDLRPENNITYYPYAIYRIIDSMLPNGIRKSRILECVHLQSSETMRVVDGIYEAVQKDVPELKAKPTNRHEYTVLL